MKPPFEVDPNHHAHPDIEHAWYAIMDADGGEVCRVVFPNAAHQSAAEDRAEDLVRMLNAVDRRCGTCKHMTNRMFTTHCKSTGCAYIVNGQSPGWEPK
jgi:hypothetical protein